MGLDTHQSSCVLLQYCVTATSGIFTLVPDSMCCLFQRLQWVCEWMRTVITVLIKKSVCQKTFFFQNEPYNWSLWDAALRLCLKQICLWSQLLAFNCKIILNKRPDGQTSSAASENTPSNTPKLTPNKHAKQKRVWNQWKIFEKMTKDLNHVLFWPQNDTENRPLRQIFNTPLKVAQIVM